MVVELATTGEWIWKSNRVNYGRRPNYWQTYLRPAATSYDHDLSLDINGEWVSGQTTMQSVDDELVHTSPWTHSDTSLIARAIYRVSDRQTLQKTNFKEQRGNYHCSTLRRSLLSHISTDLQLGLWVPKFSAKNTEISGNLLIISK